MTNRRLNNGFSPPPEQLRRDHETLNRWLKFGAKLFVSGAVAGSILDGAKTQKEDDYKKVVPVLPDGRKNDGTIMKSDAYYYTRSAASHAAVIGGITVVFAGLCKLGLVLAELADALSKEIGIAFDNWLEKRRERVAQRNVEVKQEPVAVQSPVVKKTVASNAVTEKYWEALAFLVGSAIGSLSFAVAIQSKVFRQWSFAILENAEKTIPFGAGILASSLVTLSGVTVWASYRLSNRKNEDTAEIASKNTLDFSDPRRLWQYHPPDGTLIFLARYFPEIKKVLVGLNNESLVQVDSITGFSSNPENRTDAVPKEVPNPLQSVLHCGSFTLTGKSGTIFVTKGGVEVWHRRILEDNSDVMLGDNRKLVKVGSSRKAIETKEGWVFGNNLIIMGPHAPNIEIFDIPTGKKIGEYTRENFDTVRPYQPSYDLPGHFSVCFEDGYLGLFDLNVKRTILSQPFDLNFKRNISIQPTEAYQMDPGPTWLAGFDGSYRYLASPRSVISFNLGG